MSYFIFLLTLIPFNFFHLFLIFSIHLYDQSYLFKFNYYFNQYHIVKMNLIIYYFWHNPIIDFIFLTIIVHMYYFWWFDLLINHHFYIFWYSIAIKICEFKQSTIILKFNLLNTDQWLPLILFISILYWHLFFQLSLSSFDPDNVQKYI